MTKAEAVSILENMEEEALFADGYEEAILGVAQRIGSTPVIIYDREKCIQILMDRDGMSHEEAEEFFSFNTVGAYVGEQTPIFAVLGD